MSNIVFPEGISWECRYATGVDFLSPEIKLDGSQAYYYSKNQVIDVKADVSETTQSTHMFANCRARYIKNLNLLNLQRCDNMFYTAPYLRSIPQLDTSNVTNTSYMFQSCSKVMYIPPLDVSKTTSVTRMFSGCPKLTNVPVSNLSKVTGSLDYMFSECSLLSDIPDLNISSVTSFGSSQYSSWLYNSPSIKSIGVLDCDSISNINYVLGGGTNYRLKHLGGFRNLGKKSSVSGTNGSYFLEYAPNLTRQSLINVFNELYDRASAGLSVLTLKLHTNHMAILSDEDKAIATNKGWTLS